MLDAPASLELRGVTHILFFKETCFLSFGLDSAVRLSRCPLVCPSVCARVNAELFVGQRALSSRPGTTLARNGFTTCEVQNSVRRVFERPQLWQSRERATCRRKERKKERERRERENREKTDEALRATEFSTFLPLMKKLFNHAQAIKFKSKS